MMTDNGTHKSGKTQQPYGDNIALDALTHRILAHNPSPYTYYGTQSYMVGDGKSCAIIDPGPNISSHIHAMIRAIGTQKLTAIICTHTHKDHSPAAMPLAQMTGAPIIGCAPLVINDDEPRSDESFDRDYQPDTVLSHGDTVKGEGWTLEAIATPGHTSNHLCYALHETGGVFTGDHVMGWSTSVISPPDGNMADYMASLLLLYERKQDKVYYPAHRTQIDKPHQLVRGMMGHRKQREKQILRALEEQPDSIAHMVPKLYKGLDEKLHGAAGRSVLAHLLDLKEKGKVDEHQTIWRII